MERYQRYWIYQTNNWSSKVRYYFGLR